MVNEDAPNGDAVVVVEMVVVMVLVAGAALPAVDVNVRLGVAPNPAKQLGVSVDDVVEVVEVMAPLKPPNKAGVLAAGADVVAMVETEGAAAVVAVTVPGNGPRQTISLHLSLKELWVLLKAVKYWAKDCIFTCRFLR